jgi:hypothetical protein
MVTGASFKYVWPFASTTMWLIFGFSFCGGGGLPEGSAISRLFIICGVVMMKITSNTNTRSSNGVMFNSLSVL